MADDTKRSRACPICLHVDPGYPDPVAISLHRAHALLPPHGYQHGRNVVDSPLRSQEIKLRRRVPRVQHLDPHPDPTQMLPRLGAQRRDPRSDAYYEDI